MESIPFSLDLGLSTIQGVLRLERTDLVIEWRRYDLFDSPQGELESLRVPYARLRRVDFQRRPVGSHVLIQADGASAFATVPLPSGEITTLRATIKRRHRSDALGWAAEAGLRVAEADEPDMIPES